MADIYAFSPNWEIPAPLKEKLDALVAEWVAAHPSAGGGADLQAAKDYTDSKTAFKQTLLANGTDINTIRARGVYLVGDRSSAQTMTNLPFTGGPGVLIVEATPGGLVFQMYHAYGAGGGIFHRRTSGISPEPLPYSPWVKLDRDTGVPSTTLSGTEDFNNLRDAGQYVVISSSVAQGISNMPGTLKRAGVLEVVRTPAGLIFQTYKEYGGSMWFRSTASVSTTPYPFGDWKDLADGGPTAPTVEVDPLAGAAFTNRGLVEAFTAARGGTIGTGGTAAIAFRYDHGLGNFRDKVLPLHRERRIPLANAINAGRIDHSENGGVTWEDLAGWVANDGVQIMAHSFDHGPAPTVAAIIDEVDKELPLQKQYLPEHVVEYFAIPGVSGGAPGNWMNWTTGDTVAHYTDEHPAAKAVLRRYAVTSGYMDGVYRPQSGQVRQGLSHMTMDGLTTLAECKSVIDAAVEQGSALQVMIHPSLIDTEGKITTTVIGQMLDYVVSLQEQGKLMVLSPSGLLLADSAHVRRHDILHHGDFADLTKWANTTGWAFSGGVASTTTGTPLRRVVSLSNARYARGRHREMTAKFKAPTGAVVRLEASSSTGGVSIIRDITIPASSEWVRLSVPVHLPVSASGLTISLGRVSGGAVDMRHAGLLAL